MLCGDFEDGAFAGVVIVYEEEVWGSAVGGLQERVLLAL